MNKFNCVYKVIYLVLYDTGPRIKIKSFLLLSILLYTCIITVSHHFEDFPDPGVEPHRDTVQSPV